MAKKTRTLTQARTCADLGMDELAVNLWKSAAAYEEQISPLLEALDRHREAALHRVSSASCYERAGELARAANLYRAALAGSLGDQANREVNEMLSACLKKLAKLPVVAASS
jgi:hypothetical protein